jgi:hypothetical protein
MLFLCCYGMACFHTSWLLSLSLPLERNPLLTVFLSHLHLPSPFAPRAHLSTSVSFQTRMHSLLRPPLSHVCCPSLLNPTPKRARLAALLIMKCSCRISSSARRSSTAPTRSSIACQVHSFQSQTRPIVKVCDYNLGSLGPVTRLYILSVPAQLHIMVVSQN